MDRISTLRNIEDALTQFEEDDLSLPELEREVRGVLRTYATEFEDGEAYRATGNSQVRGLVVVAESRTAAREKVESLLEEPPAFGVERIE